MRPIVIAALLLAGMSSIALGQTPPQQNTPDPSKKVAPPKKTPASPTDLDVIKTVLLDVVNNKELGGLIISRNAPKNDVKDWIVVVNVGLENLTSKSDKIVLSDLKSFGLELKKARSVPNYEYFDDAWVWGDLFMKFFPHAKALISRIDRPTYPNSETAVLMFWSGPGSHGDATNTYTLKKKDGKWNVIKREVWHPV